MTVQSLPACWSIETLTASPGRTANGTWCGLSGSVSIQASYRTWPDPETISSVPAWMRSRLLSPPIPTQTALSPAALVVAGWGTVHVPDTAVKLPPLAAYPAQFDDWFRSRPFDAGGAVVELG